MQTIKFIEDRAENVCDSTHNWEYKHGKIVASVGLNGRWVTFGGLTGADVKLNVQSHYSTQIKLIGPNGGTRKEITEVIEMSKELKTRVWKIFTLDEAKEALEALQHS